MGRLLTVTLLAAALGGTLAGDASAAAALLAVDDATPSLAEGDDGWSGTLGLTNLTDGALTLSAAPADGRAGCTPALSRAAIGAAQSLETKLTVPKACKAGDDEVALTLTAKGAAMQELPVTAELKAAQADPDWDQLAAFPVRGVRLHRSPRPVHIQDPGTLGCAREHAAAGVRGPSAARDVSRP